MEMKVAILEDDPLHAELIEGILDKAGYNCKIFVNPHLLFGAVGQHTFDILITDWNLPDISGVEVIERLREKGDRRIPILMVTARDASQDIVQSLQAGADDFITKPVQADVLLARVEAILRRAYGDNPVSEIEQFGAYEFARSTRVVKVNGEVIRTTAREFELALLLFQNLGRPLSRSYIMEMLWSLNPDVSTRTLDTHVARIRTKLKFFPEHNGYRMTSIYGFGYRLDAVTEAEADCPSSDTYTI